MTEQAQKIQVLLFVAGEAVPKVELVELLKESPESINQHLDELRAELEHQGIALVVTDTHAQLSTAPAMAEFLASFQKEELGELTKAAAETLAIIAYRGPIARYDIDMLRGVDSRSMIRGLMRRGIVRRLQRSGRTPMYDVTEEFLLNLGIEKREDLSDFATLSSHEAIQRILDSSQHGSA